MVVQTIDSVFEGQNSRIDATITLLSSLFDHFQVFSANIYQHDNKRTKKQEISIFQEIKQKQNFRENIFLFFKCHVLSFKLLLHYFVLNLGSIYW